MKINTEKLENLWNSDELRILVLGSLTIQIALIFLAPLRKRITNIMLVVALWLLYLTADNVATLGLGNISHQTPAGSGVSSELTVLWAPFLLVHLGGPDTITSYSIEDNELWWRHLLGLLFQVIITVYIFIQSPPTGWLWIPTVFVFIPGLIKFAERTHALRIASKDNIKDKIISELRPGNRTVEVNRETTPSGFWGTLKSVLFPPEDNIDISVSSYKDISEDESARILEGFRWFNIFKRLLVDVTFSADLLMKSQDRFSDLSTTVALDLVAIELSFLYDYLHTKAVHMHSILGRVLRYFSLVSIIAALVVFRHLDMQKYVSGDIIITYILFGVGLFLEVIATILLVFSDWTVMALKRTQHSDCVAGCITALMKAILKKKNRRWGHTIGHFNLVGVCLRDRDTKLAKIMRILKIKNKWDNMWERELNPLLPEGLLEEIMVTEAKRRAQNVHIYKVLVEARAYRGDKTLERLNQLETLNWSMKREFDESIILWHLATDICYYLDETSNNPNGEKQQPSSQPNGENQQPSHQPNIGENQEPSNQPNVRNEEPSNQPNGREKIPINGTCGLKYCLSGTSKQSNGKEDTERDVSWKTSNYMIYLLTQQQSMMQLGYGKTRFEATCAVVKKKLKGKGKLEHKKACEELNKKAPVNPEQNDASVSADGSQPTNKMGTSVLKKICANLRQWGTSVLKKIRANLRCWGRPKREEENNAQVSEEDKRKREEDNRKREEENNAPVSTDSSQPTNKMGTSEENNAPVSTDSIQPTNKIGTSVLKKIWANLRQWDTSVLKKIWGYVRFWGRRKREEGKRKRKYEDDMGELVLRDSLRLAKELQDLKPEIKWKLISETWMEMLGYAAIHCDSYQHAKSLSRGGELLTHLWLLMSQLGVVEEHKMQQYQSGTV